MTSIDGHLRSLSNSIFLAWRKSLADRSVHSKCRIQRLKQSHIAERLVQACHGTLFEQARTDRLISMSGDEDNGNLLSAKLQFPLEIGSSHTQHGDVEDQAFG